MASCWGECLPLVSYRMRHVSRGVWMQVCGGGVHGCARRAVFRETSRYRGTRVRLRAIEHRPLHRRRRGSFGGPPLGVRENAADGWRRRARALPGGGAAVLRLFPFDRGVVDLLRRAPLRLRREHYPGRGGSVSLAGPARIGPKRRAVVSGCLRALVWGAGRHGVGARSISTRWINCF